MNDNNNCVPVSGVIEKSRKAKTLIILLNFYPVLICCLLLIFREQFYNYIGDSDTQIANLLYYSLLIANFLCIFEVFYLVTIFSKKIVYDSASFTYTDFFRRSFHYRYTEIREIRTRNASRILFMKDKKIMLQSLLGVEEFTRIAENGMKEKRYN